MKKIKETIFISYAREDIQIAEKISNDLKNLGFDVWFDKNSLLPGQNWKREIKKAIENSSYFIALLSSNSISKQGYVHKELKVAIELLDELPESKIFIIPVRLEECEPTHDRLKDLQWVDLFISYENGIKNILRVLVPALLESQKLAKINFEDTPQEFKRLLHNILAQIGGLKSYSSEDQKKDKHIDEILKIISEEAIHARVQMTNYFDKIDVSNGADKFTPQKKIKIRALFVEDEHWGVTSYFKELENNDFECVLATNGDEAVENLSTSKFDLVIIDIMFPPGNSLGKNNMPIKAGLRLLEMIRSGQIKNCNQDIDVIILTAVIDHEIETQIITLGISAYLKKPVEFKKVIETFCRVKEQIISH